jgi:UDP-perosamine 4-acetyltransferase
MQSREIILIGGGGHTRVLIGMLQSLKAPIRGIVTSNAELVGTEIFDVPVLGIDGQVPLDPATSVLINGVGNRATRNGAGLTPRADLYNRYRAQGFDFLPLVAKEAIVMGHVTMGEGVQIMPGAVVQPGVIIGENAIINTRASIDHDSVIAPHAHIAPGALLCGNVSIGEACHIGAGAVIIQGIRIGEGAVIGAGSVVTEDVSAGAVIRPAKA